MSWVKSRLLNSCKGIDGVLLLILGQEAAIHRVWLSHRLLVHVEVTEEVVGLLRNRVGHETWHLLGWLVKAK
jgi:hypothetical protein